MLLITFDEADCAPHCNNNYIVKIIFLPISWSEFFVMCSICVALFLVEDLNKILRYCY